MSVGASYKNCSVSSPFYEENYGAYHTDQILNTARETPLTNEEHVTGDGIRQLRSRQYGKLRDTLYSYIRNFT